MSETKTKYFIEINGNQYSTFCTEESVNYALNYKPLDDDLFVVSYPKCGTTWTQHMIYLIFNDGVQEIAVNYYPGSTWLEYSGVDTVWKPLIKTHLAYDLLPKNKAAKYVLVFRNPKDTVVSFYYLLRANKGVDVISDFHQFFNDWIAGQVYGNYFTHVRDYWGHRNDENILYLVYEQMKRNPKEAVLKIADFLGETYVRKLCDNNEEILKRVLKYSTIGNMAIDGDKNDRHIRKGIVGDWRSHLTKDESDLIDAKVEEYFVGTELQYLWREDMKWF